MVAMISVICIKSGKKKLPPADVIPEVSERACVGDKRIKLCTIESESKTDATTIRFYCSITSPRRDTKTAIDIRTQARGRIPTTIIPSIPAPRVRRHGRR